MTVTMEDANNHELFEEEVRTTKEDEEIRRYYDSRYAKAYSEVAEKIIKYVGGRGYPFGSHSENQIYAWTLSAINKLEEEALAGTWRMQFINLNKKRQSKFLGELFTLRELVQKTHIEREELNTER